MTQVSSAQQAIDIHSVPYLDPFNMVKAKAAKGNQSESVCEAQKLEAPLEGFDRVFPLIGGHGRYQWTLLAIISLGGIQAIHLMGYSFLGAIPDHWCDIKELSDVGWTPEQVKNLSIPTYTTAKGQIEYDQCSYYDLDYDRIKEPGLSYAKAYEGIDFKAAKTKPCSTWVYDTNVFLSTVATEFNLVCGRKYLAATIQATFMAGYLVGSLLGSLSDRILGRRGCVLLSSTLIILGSFGSGFAWAYPVFILFRFMVAIGAAGSFQNRFTILAECCDTRSRAAFGFLQNILFSSFYMVMALYGYLLRDWHNLQLAFAASSLVLVSFIWILPESARWLVSKDRDQEAITILEGIARTNKRPPPDRAELEAIFESCKDKAAKKDTDQEQSQSSWARRACAKSVFVLKNYSHLVRTRELRRRTLIIWILSATVTFVYYGISFGSPTLSRNPFIVVFFNALVEIPAYLGVVLTASKWGRKPTVASSFLIAGFACLATSLLPNEFGGLRVFFSMVGKLFITGCLVTITLLSTELYPTSARATGLGAAAMVGRFGSMTAPYVAIVKSVYTDLPTVIFAVTALLAGIVALMLPETKDTNLLEHVSAVEAAAARHHSTRRSSHHELTTTSRNSPSDVD